MSVVIDTSLLIAVALNEPAGRAILELTDAWRVNGEDLHAPVLTRFEVANSLLRAVKDHRVEASSIADIWADIARVRVIYHEMADDGPATIDVALQLRRRSAYDAAYIVLAQRIGCEVWTLDQRLARNAQDNGFPVRLVTAAGTP